MFFKEKAFVLILCSSVFLIADESKIYINMNPIVFNYSNNGTTTDFKPTGFKWTAGYVVKDFDFVSFGLDTENKLQMPNANIGLQL